MMHDYRFFLKWAAAAKAINDWRAKPEVCVSQLAAFSRDLCVWRL